MAIRITQLGLAFFWRAPFGTLIPTVNKRWLSHAMPLPPWSKPAGARAKNFEQCKPGCPQNAAYKHACLSSHPSDVRTDKTVLASRTRVILLGWVAWYPSRYHADSRLSLRPGNTP